MTEGQIDCKHEWLLKTAECRLCGASFSAWRDSVYDEEQLELAALRHRLRGRHANKLGVVSSSRP